MEDGSLIAWKDDGGDLSEILPDWFMKISVKFLPELSALLKRKKFGSISAAGQTTLYNFNN